MDKLYAIKIRQSDGTYGAAIPVSVLAENVDWNSTLSLVDILGQVDTSESIQDQINNLKNTRATQASVNALDQKVDNAVEYITHNSEIADARQGVDGTEYSTLKERLDNEYNDLQSKSSSSLIMVNEEPVSATKMVVETGENTIELALQSDLDATRSAINTFPNSMRKFFFIGDSYMQGYTPGSETQKGWASHVIEMMHLTEGVNAFQLNSSDISGVTTGGWGMAPTDGDNHTAWSDLVSNISSSASIPFSEITDVVILGGTNDEDYFSSIETGINNLDTAIRTKFPNVKRISLGVLAWVNIKRFRDYVRPVYNAYARCVKKGWHFFRNIVWAAHRFSYISSDGVHLTQVGYYDVASYIVDCIINGDCNVQWNQNVKIDTPSTSGITSTHENQYIEFNFLNGIHTVRFNGTHVNGSSNAIGFTLSTAIAAIGYYGIAVLPDFVMSLSLAGDNGNISLTNLYKLSGNQDIVHMSLILRDRQIQLQERLSGGLTTAMDVINHNPIPVTVSGWDM